MANTCYLVDISDIFYLFSARGRARGIRGDRERGCRFSIENPRGGISEEKGGGGGEAAKGPGGCLQGIWGGGLNIFFRGRNSHQG